MNNLLIIESGPGGKRVVECGLNFQDADAAVRYAQGLAQECKVDGARYGVFQLVGGFKVNCDTFVETFFP